MIERSRDRIQQTGEVFTPPNIVNDMLAKLPQEVFDDDGKTFLDPACGDGNFLTQILHRKLSNGHSPIQAISTIYGVDIMPDNILACRERLFKQLHQHYKDTNQVHMFASDADELWKLLCNNIIWHNGLTYHYRFDGTYDEQYTNQPE